MDFSKILNAFLKKSSTGVDLKKDKLYFYSALAACVFISAVFLFGVILPKVISYSSLKREFQEKEKEFKLRSSIVQENQKLKKRIAEIEKDYEYYKTTLFLPNDISGAVKEITNISRDLGVDFISFTPLPMTKLKNLPLGAGFSLWKASLSIRIKTGYAKFIKFIQRVEKSDKFMRLEDFKIKKNPTTLLVHDMDITLCGYSLQQEKQ